MELKYNSLKEFKKDYPNEYQSLYRKKLLEKLCEDMGWDIPIPKKTAKPRGYWNIFDNLYQDALKYDTKEKWRFNGNGAYTSAIKNSWFQECTAHMISIGKKSGYWTKEKCLENALKYNTRKEWFKKSGGAVKSAKKNGWYDECVKHMVRFYKPKGYWTKEHCMEEALKFKTKSEWDKATGGYEVARVNNWLDECCAHMEKKGYKPRGYWDEEKCLETALKYTNKTKWIKENFGAYEYAKRNNYYEECTKHMKNNGK